MARIRSLKPEFFTDSQMVALSPYARLLYQGMWCHGDEWGVLEDDPVQLKMRILPVDPVNAEELLDELIKAGRVRRARTCSDKSVLVVVRFRDHQRPDGRLEPRFGDPATFIYDDDDETTSDLRVQTSADMSLHVATCGEGQGSGYRGQGSGDEVPADAGTEPPAKPKRATQLPASWAPNDDHRAQAAKLAVSLTLAEAKFRDHAAANGRTLKDWDAGFRNWLRNERPTPTARGRPAHAASDVTEDQRHDPDFWRQ